MGYATSPTGKSSILPYPPYSSAYNRIAKRLEMVVKALGFKGKELTIKGLRATYGIRRVTITRDIFHVAREMGHRSVTTTERHYLRFPLERRLADFPSLARHIENTTNKAILGDGGYELVDTRAYLRAYIEERQNNAKSSITVTNNTVTQYPNIVKLNGTSSV